MLPKEPVKLLKRVELFKVSGVSDFWEKFSHILIDFNSINVLVVLL